MSTSLPKHMESAAHRGRALATSGRRGPGPLRRLLEILYLRVYNGIGVREYDALGLGRPSLTWREKREFVGKQWYSAMIDGINPAEYRMAAWNKVVANAVLQSFSVPTPAIYGTASPHNGTTCDGRALRSARDLEELIDRFVLNRVCFKLVGGWSGRGFMLCTIDRTGARPRVHIDGAADAVDMETFWSTHIAPLDATDATPRQRAFGYLCQEVLTQHPAVAALHPESVNTARVWMAQRSRGEWEMVGAVLRMGTGNKQVDNGVAGGIGAPIDIETGRMGRAVRRGRPGVEFREYEYHPTTGALIAGVELPLWASMEPLCRRACGAFPYLRFMGLDVAITSDGPVIVEVEADPHQSHQAHLGRGIRSLLIELSRTIDASELR